MYIWCVCGVVGVVLYMVVVITGFVLVYCWLLRYMVIGLVGLYGCYVLSVVDISGGGLWLVRWL